jgi:hypothetical protein
MYSGGSDVGIFANGTEGQLYQEKYCFEGADGNYCVNFKDRDDGLGLGCPVWDMHLFYNGNEEWADICDYLIPVVDGENKKCIWHNRLLNVDTEEAINMTLDDWKQLERGDVDVQIYFEFMPDALVALRHDGIQVIQEPKEPTPVPCDKNRKVVIPD